MTDTPKDIEDLAAAEDEGDVVDQQTAARAMGKRDDVAADPAAASESEAHPS